MQRPRPCAAGIRWPRRVGDALTCVDTYTILLKTIKSFGEDLRAKVPVLRNLRDAEAGARQSSIGNSGSLGGNHGFQ
jgi:hypothetical protein